MTKTNPLSRLRASLLGESADPCIVGPWREVKAGDRWARHGVTGEKVVTVIRDPKRSPASGKSRYRASVVRLVNDQGEPRYQFDDVANAHGSRHMLTPTAAMQAADGWLRARGYALLREDEIPAEDRLVYDDTDWILAASERSPEDQHAVASIEVAAARDRWPAPVEDGREVSHADLGQGDPRSWG